MALFKPAQSKWEQFLRQISKSFLACMFRQGYTSVAEVIQVKAGDTDYYKLHALNMQHQHEILGYKICACVPCTMY